VPEITLLLRRISADRWSHGFMKTTMASINIVIQDILENDSDVIVFSAHPSLRSGSGVSGIIHKAAGDELEAEAVKYAPLDIGEAIVTSASALKAKYVIHTVCPRYIYGNAEEESLLAQSYRSALSFSRVLENAKSIAFVSLGTGVYRWPVDRAARIAIKELLLSEFNSTSICLNEKNSYLAYLREYNKQILK